MSTPPNEVTLETALGGVPRAFRGRLIKTHGSLKEAYRSGQHDAAGLRAGKFCEVALRLLQDHLTGSYTPFGTKITNFNDECRKLENQPKSAGVESMRVIVPRALNFLYTLRNKRGIGHEGGDVDANEIDAATCVRLADWCICEFVRVFHQLSLEEAQAIVDAAAERDLPDVWDVAGKKRVLNHALSYRDQVLTLLKSDPNAAVPVEDLAAWLDHPNLPELRRSVLKPMHQKRLVEFDRETDSVVISPLGVKELDE
jgi:hypothetical protein